MLFVYSGAISNQLNATAKRFEKVAGFLSSTIIFAEEPKSIGKYKNWQTFVYNDSKGKVCFAQSSPVLQAPKKNKRDARLFVTFRPSEKISNEISTTAGYEFNKKNSVLAT